MAKDAAQPLPNAEKFSREEFAAISLLTGIAEEKPEAFNELYRLWAATFLGIAVRMLGDRAEAEEAVQDTFVKIWRQAGTYPASGCRPFVWAFTILRSTCLDRLRFRSRKKRSGTVLIGDHPNLVDFEPVQPEVVCADLIDQIQRGLTRLSPEERRCIELYVFEEFTHDEISTALASPLGTVKTRMRRALKNLRLYLTHYETE